MSYSQLNPAWDRMLKGQYEARIQWEAARAGEIQAKDPAVSRSDALKRACREYDAGGAFNGNCLG